jgi:hypothetical protein
VNIAFASSAAKATSLLRSGSRWEPFRAAVTRMRLQGEPPAVYELIAPAFETLAKRADHDHTRPGIEFYRRRDVIDLLLPIT